MSHPQQCSEERGHFRRPDGKECYCGTLLFDGCFITLRRKLDADSLDLTIDVTDQDVTRYIISNRTPKQTTLNLHLGRFLDLSPPITGEYESLTIRTPLPEELAKLPHSKPMRTDRKSVV